MKEVTFKEVKVGQSFYLDSKGNLTEWKKVEPSSVPGTNGVYERNTEADRTNIYVAEEEKVWIK